MYHIGCPIIGDPKYGGKKTDGAPDTQMLAAVELTFDGLKICKALDGKKLVTDNGFDLGFSEKLDGGTYSCRGAVNTDKIGKK